MLALLRGKVIDLCEFSTVSSDFDSFRSTNSNPQDFIPYLRYWKKRERTATAVEVRKRRDKWLAAMLDGVRESLRQRIGDKKCVAKLLLTDNQEGLTKRKCFPFNVDELRLMIASRCQNNTWWPHVRRLRDRVLDHHNGNRHPIN